MATKRKGGGPTSKGTSEAKKALAGMEQGHKILQLNLKKLHKIVSGHFHAGVIGGHFGGLTAGHFGGRARASKKAR